MLGLILFIVILIIVVMIHEFGHFIMAKRAGIGVEEFGFGLPPRLWGKKIGETIYSINWLPFGGFVRLVGEDSADKSAKKPNSFAVKSVKERILVVVAGVFANFLLAVVIFYITLFALGFKVNMPLLVSHKFSFVNQSTQVLVEDVSPGSVAEKAGIKVGDSILKVDGQSVNSIGDLQHLIRSSQDKKLEITLENTVNNKERMIEVTPAYNEELKAPALGVALGESVVLNYQTFPQKLFSGFSHSYNTVVYSAKVIGQLIGFSVKEHNIAPVSQGVSGPIGIFGIIREAVKFGPIPVLQLIGLLSLNLALINILPIPAMDGGRLFFIIVEGVTRKKVNPNVEKWIHQIGFALLLALILLVSYNDIIKLIR